MSWFKLDDQFATHPKVMRAGPEASWLFVAMGCYCAKHLTDGSVPKAAMSTLAAVKSPAKLVARLVEVGLVEEAEHDYLLHDYLAYNPSREEVESERRRRRDSGAKGARARWDGERETAGQSTGDGTCHDVTDNGATGTSDAPVPSRPKKENGRRKQRPTAEFVPTDVHKLFAQERGLDLHGERAHWLEWCEANGRTYSSVNAGFSTWLRQAVQFGRAKTNGHGRVDFDRLAKQ